MNTQKISRKDFQEVYNAACSNWKDKFNKMLELQKFNIDIEFKEDEIQVMYSVSDKDQTKVLDKYFILPKNSWQSVVDFESACIFNGDNDKYKINQWVIADLSETQIAGLKLEYCIKTINQDWKPNPKDSNEPKWYIWFEYKKSLGWVVHAVDFRHCLSYLGFGFYYQTKEKAEHGGKYFKQYYDI